MNTDTKMKIAIVGPGHIGGNLAAQWAKAGHEVTICFSHDEQKLHDLAAKLGHGVKVATPAEAVASSDVVALSVPWSAIDIALQQVGDLSGKIVIDTTNQFGAGSKIGDQTAVSYNQARMPGAMLAKSFNTMTAHYQVQVGNGEHGDVAMFFVSAPAGKDVVSQLVADTGFVPVYLGDLADASIMEAPRRSGAVYGEAYTPDDAQKIATAVHSDKAAAGEMADNLKIV